MARWCNASSNRVAGQFPVMAESALAAPWEWHENRKGPDVGPGPNFVLLLSSRTVMRTLGQEQGSCQIQIFSVVYLFFPVQDASLPDHEFNLPVTFACYPVLRCV